MKKIEAVVPGPRLERALEALKELNLGGITYFESKGRGEISRPKMQTGRGTGSYTPEFNINSTIMMVVPDSMVDRVVEKILSSTSSGLKGEGKIFVSGVDKAYDIATKTHGETAL